MTLISASELAALQAVAESGMDTPVYISPKVTDRNAPDGSKVSWPTENSPVMGWLYEFTPGGATIGVVSGQMGLSEELWLRLPVGTVINAGDHARVGTSTFVVQHTNEDSRYKAWIACAVRIVV